MDDEEKIRLIVRDELQTVGHPCSQEAIISKLDTNQQLVLQEMLGESGLIKSFPRLEQKVEDLTGKVSTMTNEVKANTNVVGNLISAIEKKKGFENGVKSVRNDIADEKNWIDRMWVKAIMLVGIFLSSLFAVLGLARSTSNSNKINGIQESVRMFNTPLKDSRGSIRWQPLGIIVDSLNQKKADTTYINKTK